VAETFKLVSQTQTSEVNPAGTGFHTVWNVRFEVTSGPARGSQAILQFPEDEHKADIIGKAIADKVSDMTAIAALGGK
jgi:hypothetical protein